MVEGRWTVERWSEKKTDSGGDRRVGRSGREEERGEAGARAAGGCRGGRRFGVRGRRGLLLRGLWTLRCVCARSGKVGWSGHRKARWRSRRCKARREEYCVVTDSDRSVVAWVASNRGVGAQDVMARFGVGRTVVASDPSRSPGRARHIGPSAPGRRAPSPRRTQVPRREKRGRRSEGPGATHDRRLELRASRGSCQREGSEHRSPRTSPA